VTATNAVLVLSSSFLASKRQIALELKLALVVQGGRTELYITRYPIRQALEKCLNVRPGGDLSPRCTISITTSSLSHVHHPLPVALLDYTSTSSTCAILLPSYIAHHGATENGSRRKTGRCTIRPVQACPTRYTAARHKYEFQMTDSSQESPRSERCAYSDSVDALLESVTDICVQSSLVLRFVKVCAQDLTHFSSLLIPAARINSMTTENPQSAPPSSHKRSH